MLYYSYIIKQKEVAGGGIVFNQYFILPFITSNGFANCIALLVNGFFFIDYTSFFAKYIIKQKKVA
jgi:hypothetical protein